MNWKPGDNPDSVHRLNFPNCDFYMKLEPVEGIIILVTFLRFMNIFNLTLI